MHLDWKKCEGHVWCDLNKLDIEHPLIEDMQGVFIIWTASSERSVIYAGSGRIAKSLKKCRSDLAIQAFARLGLLVSWAEVEPEERENVRSFLVRTLNPKIPVLKAGSQLTEVNLPWD